MSKHARPKSPWTLEKWNARCPVGTDVEYRATWKQEEPTLVTRTRSEAWESIPGHPVVLIEGRPGAVALWALTPKRSS
jgi:hypothetical protein